ncbi:hydroxymethylglutaryl-CoA lyase [Paractinoplanes rishiriensis]|uniref:Hydroxymethylglutaryl-CoA lyase n=1 Tax=Paractinoplanes rishiriensis TaxID=1050105 RepID=A0A919K0M9_9ACTN|nr:hydroxymethylglutaryl-CoA lyase [Actinoplanes rishiriensis]GIE94451.1 hydroxymethylglutaryl-CoA lyase [Actinoplanes rishiriensis]
MTVSVVEVSPRDGLQNEAAIVDTPDKLALITTLAAAGLRRIEAVSFVHPGRVPQMADAEAVAAGLPRARVSWIGLVLNERGLDRALAAAVDEVNVVVVATDTFSHRNQGVDTAAGIAAWARIGARAREAGLRTTVTVAAAFGCPFEGAVSPERVRTVLADCVAAAAPDEVALADTIGVGVPAQVRALAATAATEARGIPLRWHFHNTRNTGYANALTAADLAGATPVALDSSAGGIGGCPFAPAATGNIATEDLLYLLHQSGYDTGVDVETLLPLASRLSTLLGHEVPGQLARAGLFPPA